MPRKGSKTITVEDIVWKFLNKRARETHRTIPGYVEYLAELDKKVERAKPVEVTA
jgi:hypothetical protein